jgi:1-phosphofructokinase family hexose kinase
MILCVSPNPALDRTIVVSAFKAGQVFRARSSLVAAGGKGINVARAATILGEDTLCMGFMAGSMGRFAASLAEEEGLKSRWVWVEGETRTCVIIADEVSGETTVINESGPTVTAQDWERLCSEVIVEAARADQICFSGSLPPGSPLESYVSLIQQTAALGKPVWIDTSGTALQSAGRMKGVTIKINSDEASVIVGVQITDINAAVQAAKQIREGGPHTVVLTLGAEGAVIAHADGCWWVKPPAVKVVDAIGSGDSFLAGLVAAFARALSPERALQYAVAAGAANATTIGGGDFPLSAFHQVLDQATSVCIDS